MSTQRDPYDLNWFGKFKFVEKDNTMTVILDRKGLDCCVFLAEISTWLFENANHKYKVSNETTPKNRDSVITFSNSSDQDAFREHFVSGVGDRVWPQYYDEDGVAKFQSNFKK